MVECRFKGWCRIEYDTDFDVCYPCVGIGAETCAEYEPMPDRDALLELADELSKPMRDGGYSAFIANRIREACGVESEAAGRHVKREEK